MDPDPKDEFLRYWGGASIDATKEDMLQIPTVPDTKYRLIICYLGEGVDKCDKESITSPANAGKLTTSFEIIKTDLSFEF